MPGAHVADQEINRFAMAPTKAQELAHQYLQLKKPEPIICACAKARTTSHIVMEHTIPRIHDA